MASVRKKAGSAHWFACFKLPTGATDKNGALVMRRVQRSTGVTDKDRALQIAITYERAAGAAAERRWAEKSARRFLAEISAIAGVSIAETEGLATFLRRWLQGRKKSLGQETFDRYANTIEDFIAFTGDGATLADITHAGVAAFRDAEHASGKGIRTTNNGVAVLAQAFDEAVKMRMLDVNPARGLSLKGEKRAAQKRHAFTFEQFSNLIRCTGAEYLTGRNPKKRGNHPEWQIFLMLAGYTGGRQQEVAKIRWRDIDTAGQRIQLGRTKNDDEHWVPLHPALTSYLKTLTPPASREAFVMPFIAGLNRRHVSFVFRMNILPRIGIVQPYADKEGKGRELAKYSIHSIRHSLATWLNEAGVSEMMRMRLIGHEDEDVSRGYTHTEIEQAAAELAKIPSIKL